MVRPVKIGDNIYQELQKLAEKTGKSMRELAEEAIQAYILGKSGGLEGKGIKGIQGKIIMLRYPSRCRRCGRQINEGDMAYWEKITYTDNTITSITICLDCYYQTSALADYYVKKRQLERTIRGLKQEADRLADRIAEMRSTIKIEEAKKEVLQIVRRVNTDLIDLIDIYTDPERQDQVREVYDRVMRTLEKAEEVLDRISSYEELKQLENRKREKRSRVVYK